MFSQIFNQCYIAISKIREKVRRSDVFCQVNNRLMIQNNISIYLIYNRIINLLVLVFYKKNINQSQLLRNTYKLFNIANKLTIIKLFSNAAQFY